MARFLACLSTAASQNNWPCPRCGHAPCDCSKEEPDAPQQQPQQNGASGATHNQ